MAKKSNKWKAFGIVMLVLLVLGGVGGTLYFTGVMPSKEQTPLPGDNNGKGPRLPSTIYCPTDGLTTVTLTAQNPLNTTGAESFDSEVTFTGTGGKKQTGTTSTADTYNLDCDPDNPITWTLHIESADGASGDNSEIVSVLEGQGAVLNDDGTISFITSGDTYRLTVAVNQHATLEFAVYDKEDARFAYDTGDASNSGYEGDGTTFTDGDNTTGFALTNDGDALDFEISVRAVQVDTEFCDQYCLIAVEAPVTEYDEPDVRFEGSVLTDVKGSLNADEEKQLAGYEYVYKVDEDIMRKAKVLDFYIEANSDASTDIQIDWYAAGVADSVNGVDLLTSTSLDDSAKTVIYTVQDIDVSVS